MLFYECNDDITKLILFELSINDIISMSKVNWYHRNIIFNKVFMEPLMNKFLANIFDPQSQQELLSVVDYEYPSACLTLIYCTEKMSILKYMSFNKLMETGLETSY